jgi:hypothetical protein
MFPSDLPTLTNPTGANDLDTPAVLHSTQHATANDLIEAIAAKLGVDASAVTTSIDYLVKAAADPGHTHTLYVPKSLFDANTVLAADTDNTPAAVTLAASTVLGRKAAGGVVAVTMAELRAILGTGTPDATTFLRGDGAWTAVSGSVATDAIFDAKGDLPVGTGADTAARLAVGTNGQVLTADSAETTGVKWATPSSSVDYPWLLTVHPFGTPISHVNWGTISAIDNRFLHNYTMESSGAQNDEINFDLIIAAGTWTFELIHQKSSARGICTLSLDGTSIGTIDMYNGTSVLSTRSSVTGVSVATTGKKRLRLKMATKNASASSYYGDVQLLVCTRTA